MIRSNQALPSACVTRYTVGIKDLRQVPPRDEELARRSFLLYWAKDLRGEGEMELCPQYAYRG